MLQRSQKPYAMLQDLIDEFGGVLPPYRYKDSREVIERIDDIIIQPAEAAIAKIGVRRSEIRWLLEQHET